MRHFWKRAAAVTGMTTAGQLVLVLVSPIIARLYGPAELGTYAVALALASICVAISTLRYSLAQSTARRDTAADGLFLVCIGMLILIAPLAAGVAVAASRISGAGGGALLEARLIGAVTAAYVFMGLVDVLSYRTIRQQNFRALSITKSAIPAAVALFQVLFGWARMGGYGLILANVVGNAIGSLILLPGALRGFRPVRRRRYYGPLLRRYRRFPLFSAPTALVDAAANQLTPVLLTTFFGGTAAGHFALVHRVLKQPTALLGLSLSHAFLAEAGTMEKGQQRDVSRFALTTLRRLALIACLLAVVGMAISPWVFVTVFGDQWAEAGRFARILVPIYLALFLYAPFHQILTIREQQHLQLGIEGSRLAAVVGILTAGAAAGLTVTSTLGLYAVGVTLAYFLGIALIIRVLRKGVHP